MSEQWVGVQVPAEHNRQVTLSDLERVAPEFLRHRPPTVHHINWDALHTRLGRSLPADYREYCAHYSGAEIDDFLMVNAPNIGREEAYVDAMIEDLEDQRELAEMDEVTEISFHPESDGLFPWGSSSSGDIFFWRMDDPDPNKWPTVVHTRNSDWWQYSGSMTSMIIGLIDGSIERWGLPPDRPGPNPTVTM